MRFLNVFYYSLSILILWILTINMSASTSEPTVNGVISISYNGNTATVKIPKEISDVSYSQEGAHVSIMSQSTSREYTYKLSGTTSDGSLTISGFYKLTLELGGLKLTNPSGPAIDIECDKRIAVVLSDGSVNRLIDGAGGSHKGALSFSGHAEFSGSGTLNVEGRSRHAIYAREYLSMKDDGLNLNITGAAGDGIHCGRGKEGNPNNYFLMEGGHVTMSNVDGDGIDADDYGVVKVRGGSIDMEVCGFDVVGLKGDSIVDVSSGSVSLRVSGPESIGIRGCHLVSISGGTLSIDVTGDGSKGIKGKLEERGTVVGGGDVTISGGTAEIRVSGGTSTQSIDEPKCMGLSVDNDLSHSCGVVRILAYGESSYTYVVKGIESTSETFYPLYVPWEYDADEGSHTMTAYVFSLYLGLLGLLVIANDVFGIW